MIKGITANLVTSDFTIKSDGIYVTTNGNPGALLVHADWCGHCKNFIPTLQSINNKLNSKSIRFPLLAITDEELKKDGGRLSSALQIEGFPTIFYFDQYGKIIGNYDGSRNEQVMLDNICKIYHHCVKN